jgi:hypothetical protein
MARDLVEGETPTECPEPHDDSLTLRMLKVCRDAVLSAQRWH